MRVHELAKDLGLSSKELIDLLARLKVSVKSHSSSLDESTVRRAREQVAARGGKAAAPAAPAAPPRAEVKTPTGERIISIRKIGAPVEPPAEFPAVPALRAAGTPETAPVEQPAAGAPAAPAAAAPAAPKAPPKLGEAAPPIRIAPVKPPSREAAREATREAGQGEEISKMLDPTDGQAPPPVSAPRPAKPPEAPKRPERRLPPPPPPRRFQAERRTRRAERKVEAPAETTVVLPTEITLSGPVAVGDLAARLGLSVGDVVRKRLEFGILAGVNQQLSEDVVLRTAESFGVTVRKPAAVAKEAVKRPTAPAEEGAVPRAPVVTVMGHVDHGKTSLLDAIRTTTVAAQEFGGITQHIGASTVQVDGRKVVFIDTPGHEAFTALRARGAQVTDIAVLVVAADDGVMPQTVEAINHARAAGVPIIVAINKVDLPQANPDRVKQALVEHGLVPEEWGGDTIMVPVSARQGTGLDHLLEMILLVAELQDLRAEVDRPARGTVIEARLDRGRGPVATVLIQEGRLNIGDAVVTGESYGRVRAMTDARGQRVDEATPSTPVEVVGVVEVPTAGDLLEVVRDERMAKAVAEERRERRRAAEMAVTRRGGGDEAGSGPKELRLIIKADAHGSVEALTAAIGKLPLTEVAVSILHAGVGNVTESDIMLAAASRAVVIGFNVRPDAQVRRVTEEHGVDVRLYRVIYEALDDLVRVQKGLFAPRFRESTIGQAEARQIFTIARLGVIAGSYVSSGRIVRGALAR